MNTTDENTAYLETAKCAAQEAGAVLRDHGEKLRHVNFQSATDVKLQADTESEQRVRKYLSKHTPYRIVGEEEGGDTSLPHGDEPYWVVDPLDGTYNYLRRQSLCCVSIGLMQGEEPLLGVIYDFNEERIFSATGAGPLFENGRTIHPDWPKQTDEACIACGFPSSSDFSEASLKRYISDIQKFKKVRMIGSAAMAIAWVATGRLDLYYENTVRLWDIAAGLALAKAAGACYQINTLDEPAPSFAYNLRVAGRKEWLTD